MDINKRAEERKKAAPACLWQAGAEAASLKTAWCQLPVFTVNC